jgi:hypothetical protein
MAIQARERAIALEPDNILYRENLKNLKRPREDKK